MTNQLPLTHWKQPNKNVATGHDPRSSGNGLLTILFGSVDRASRYEWLNAGRTLVDKTYINIFWHAKGLSPIGTTPHDIACELDNFIKDYLKPIWCELNDLNDNEKNKLAIKLVDDGASILFGKEKQLKASSWLFFYLCPQLPIIPIGNDAVSEYSSYLKSEADRFAEWDKSNTVSKPIAEYGRDKEIAIINEALATTNWWERYCYNLQELHSLT